MGRAASGTTETEEPMTPDPVRFEANRLAALGEILHCVRDINKWLGNVALTEEQTPIPTYMLSNLRIAESTLNQILREGYTKPLG